MCHTLNMWAEVKQLKLPVKLLYGLKDTFFPVEDAFDIKEAIGDNCSVTALPMCNHYAHVEHPYVVGYHILKFCDKVDSDKNLTKHQDNLKKLEREAKEREKSEELGRTISAISKREMFQDTFEN